MLGHSYHRISRISLICLLLWSSLVVAPKAQESLRFEHLGHKQGFESMWYFHIAEDSLGFLWFGGHTGLTRYDGRNAITYTHNPTDSNSLAYNQVFRVLPVGKNELWCSTLGAGLSILDIKQGTFKNYAKQQNTWPTDYLGEIIQISDSLFYFLGGGDNSVFKAIRNGDSFQFEEFPLIASSDKILFRDNKAKYFFKDKQEPSLLWIIGNFRIYQFDTKSDQLSLFHEFDFLLNQNIRFDLIPAFEWLDDDHWMLYLLTHGFQKFSLKDKSLKPLIHDKEQLPYHCRFIKKMSDNSYLFAYSDGTVFRYRYPESKFEPIRIQYPINHTPWLEYIYQLDNGDIYLTGNGNGVMKVRATYNAIKTHETSFINNPSYNLFYNNAFINDDGRKVLYNRWHTDSLFLLDTRNRTISFVKNSAISGIFWGDFIQAPSGKLYTHNGKSVFEIDMISGICHDYSLPDLRLLAAGDRQIKRIAFDSLGSMWIYGNNFLLNYVDEKLNYQADIKIGPDSLLPNYDYVVKYDDFVLFFQSGARAYLFDLENKTLSKLTLPPECTLIQYSQPIFFRKKLYIPDHINGLFECTVLNDKLLIDRIYNANNLLLSNNVYSLSVNDRFLWASTGVGFQRLDLHENKSIDIDHNFNLPQHYLNRPVQVNANGHFLVPTGLYLIYGKIKDLIPDALLVQAFITSLKINDSQAVQGYLEQGSQAIVLQPNENSFSLGWGILTQQSPHGYKVAYRLRGLNEDWVLLNDFTDFEATYTSLAPGNYTFEVQIVPNIDQASFLVLSQKIVVTPHYYQTWWFWSIIGLIILIIAYLFYRLRMDGMQREQQLRLEYSQQINQLKWEGLKSQMNPHFMYNNLNAIKSMIFKQEVQEAAAYLSKFSLYIRQTLNNSNKESITLEEELNSLKLFLDLENFRLRIKMTFESSISDDIHTNVLTLPPMVLQPLVEDVIWNSLTDSAKFKKLRFSVQHEESHLLLMEIIFEIDAPIQLIEEVASAFPHSTRLSPAIARLKQFDSGFSSKIITQKLIGSDLVLLRIILNFTNQ